MVYGFSAIDWRLPIQGWTSLVRSFTRPASACCLRTPPPQLWKRSGALPDWVVVVSLALNASFSITLILMVTLGCCAMYCLATWAQTGCSGSVFWMCHQLMVPFFEPPLDELLLSPPPPPQPARSSAAAAPRATLRRVNDNTVVSLLVSESP